MINDGDVKMVKLSPDDIIILEMEKKIIRMYKTKDDYSSITIESIDKLNIKIGRLEDAQMKMLFIKGFYRKDKKHLLVPFGNYLDVTLLDNLGDSTERKKQGELFRFEDITGCGNEAFYKGEKTNGKDNS